MQNKNVQNAFDVEESKNTIASLVAKYYKVVKDGGLKRYTEEETKKDFILPLFKALGWDVDDKREVSAEEHMSSGRPDYGFYIDGWTKFYLEAKPLKSDLNREEYARQAVSYSWNKDVTWAILTDFESLKVFNAQNVNSSLGDKLFFEIHCDEYLDRYDQLYLLSRQAFEIDGIDAEATKFGKKLQRESVTISLYKDLNEARKLLTKGLSMCNPDVEKNLLDEGIQKLLDRIIFLRVAEDRKIEPSTLRGLVREYQTKGAMGEDLYDFMIKKFRELDKVYNSNLFSEHAFEKWDEFSGNTEKAIELFYGKSGYYEYDFSIIPADVLGSVYENYLSYQLAQSENEISVSKDSKKRKEQGIYYTPPYIVDFIVSNALNPVLEKCKSLKELEHIKVLDPACGSGSFLIKALDVINEKYKQFGEKGDESTKVKILTNNIYGVDLDEKAVEITRLNLLINSLDQKMKFPPLDKNIKRGNSLVLASGDELEKFYGDDSSEVRVFNWKEEFPSVFTRDNPGFDVVIGNPPYIDSESMTKTMPADRNYMSAHYDSAKGNWDMFCVFIEQALRLCRKNGYHSFIVPNKLISANYASEIRKILSEQNYVTLLRDYSEIKVFPIAVYPIVYVAEKTQPGTTTTVEFAVPNKNTFKIISRQVDYEQFSNKGSWQLQKSQSLNELTEKISNPDKTKLLSEYATLTGAATVAEAYLIKEYISDDSLNSLKMVNSGTIDRYSSLWGRKEIRYLGTKLLKPTISKQNLSKISEKRVAQSESSKIVIANMTRRLECMFDEKGNYLAGKSTTIVISKNNLKVLLAVLNSNLINYFIKDKFGSNHMQGGALRLGAPELKLLPINTTLFDDKETVKEIVSIVDEMLRLQSVLSETAEKSDKWDELTRSIEKVDKKIDQLIYDVYEISTEEVAEIEASVRS